MIVLEKIPLFAQIIRLAKKIGTVTCENDYCIRNIEIICKKGI